jgi:hypothetical protein
VVLETWFDVGLQVLELERVPYYIGQADNVKDTQQSEKRVDLGHQRYGVSVHGHSSCRAA